MAVIIPIGPQSTTGDQDAAQNTRSGQRLTEYEIANQHRHHNAHIVINTDLRGRSLLISKGQTDLTAGREYAALDEAVQALFEEGNPVGVKCALSVMGKIGPTMRLPLVEGTAALREKFRRLIAEYDLR